MTITLIDRNARIPLNSLTEDIRKQWLESGAITEDEKVIAGFCMENNVWFINLRVVTAEGKIIRTPHIL